MKLKDIQHEYDLIFSLGAACQVAAQMRIHQIRKFSGPLDWYVFENTAKLIDTLNKRFTNFMKLENLEVLEIHENMYKVMDTDSTCISIHDFPANIDIGDYYQEYRNMLERRVRRFYDEIEKSRSVLFIRMHCSYDETKMLEDCLINLFGDKASLLVVNHLNYEGFFESDWKLDHTCCMNIYQRDQEWDGYLPHWNAILEGIKLSLLPVDINNNDIFINWYSMEELPGRKYFRWAKNSSNIYIKGCKGASLTFTLFTYSPNDITVRIKTGIIGKSEEYTINSRESHDVKIPIENDDINISIDSDIWIPAQTWEGNYDNRELGAGILEPCIIK